MWDVSFEQAARERREDEAAGEAIDWGDYIQVDDVFPPEQEGKSAPGGFSLSGMYKLWQRLRERPAFRASDW